MAPLGVQCTLPEIEPHHDTSCLIHTATFESVLWIIVVLASTLCILHVVCAFISGCEACCSAMRSPPRRRSKGGTQVTLGSAGPVINEV